MDKSNMNKELAVAVSEKVTFFSFKTIELVINKHQSSFPASWQSWVMSEKTKEMIELLNLAKESGETVSERIVQLDS